jgi:hypothetical protein
MLAYERPANPAIKLETVPEDGRRTPMVDRVREACEARFEAHKPIAVDSPVPSRANLASRCMASPRRLAKHSVPARIGLPCATVSQLRRAPHDG